MSFYYPEALSSSYYYPATTYTWEQTPTDWSSMGTMGRELYYDRPSDLWGMPSRELGYDRPADLWGTPSRELGYDRPSGLWGMRPRELAPMEDRSLWRGGMEMGGMETAGMGMDMSMGGWQPRCTVRGTDGGMLIEASLPGVRLEDIQLRLVEGDLILSGERREEKSHKDEGYWSRERSYGKFRRRLWLPEGVELSQIKASFNNGVLQVLVPMPGRERRERMGLGEGEELRRAEEGKQTYTEWGGAQAQPMGERGYTAQRQEEFMGERPSAISRQEERVQPMGERSPTIQRQEEAGPISEAGTKEERKPLLEKKDKEREKLERRGSGIFIGDEAPTTGESTV